MSMRKITLMRKNTSGFTIVELLIVIVVIAILAAISIVAFTGIQERARLSSNQSRLADINKLILLYHADKGEYPGTATVHSAPSGNFIPGLVPEYGDALPAIESTGNGDYWAYIVSSDKSNYKLVRLVPFGATLPSMEAAATTFKIDPQRPTRGWGVWSSGGVNL